MTLSSYYGPHIAYSTGAQVARNTAIRDKRLGFGGYRQLLRSLYALLWPTMDVLNGKDGRVEVSFSGKLMIQKLIKVVKEVPYTLRHGATNHSRTFK